MTDGGNDQEWLTRLSAAQWLAAAKNELGLCESAFARRAHRSGVTHARRGAGMALNALLRQTPNAAWGRSYMDHLRALRLDPDQPELLRNAATVLLETPPAQPELVRLSKTPQPVSQAAQTIYAWVARLLDN